MSSTDALMIRVKQQFLIALRNPGDDPRATALTFGILAVATLIVICLLLVLFFTIESYTEKRKTAKKKMSLRNRLIIISVVVVISLGLLSVPFYLTVQPSFCPKCHVVKGEYESWKKSSHWDVDCLACHSSPGIIGSFILYAKGAENAISYVSQKYSRPITASVNNEACLKCHRNVSKQIIRSMGIRVSHKEFLAKGYFCTNCHNTTAHGKIVPQTRYPSMDKCLVCHNGKTASSKCNLCHVKDVGKRIRKPKRTFPKTTLGELTTCEGCHKIDKCTRCHGLVMPHPPGWTDKATHAKFAAWEKKQLCMKCHDMEFCNECHNFPGHFAGWKEAHKQRVGFEEQCKSCHRAQEKFCALCHP